MNRPYPIGHDESKKKGLTAAILPWVRVYHALELQKNVVTVNGYHEESPAAVLVPVVPAVTQDL